MDEKRDTSVPATDAEPADDEGKRAWKITKGTTEQMVFDNRHGKRAVETLMKGNRRHLAKPKVKAKKR